MSVTGAMFTGVSGLLSNAEGISVIGNNIANVNTVGFKSGRMLFSDVLSANIGNGSQIGRGSQIQKVDNIFSQTTFESTSNVTDLAIQGGSFFAVKDPSAGSPVNQNGSLLTRAGAFRLDSNLTLVNADGYQVLDTAGNPIKFSDNAAGIANLTAALSAAASTPTATMNTQAATQLTAANTFLTAIFTAAAAVYTTEAANAVAAATTFQGVAGGTTSEQSAQASILTLANAAQTAAATATATPNADNTAAAQAAFAALNTQINNSSITTPAIVTAFTTLKATMNAVNTSIAAGAPPAEIKSASAIQSAAAAAQAAATAAISSPSLPSVQAAQTAFNALTTLANNSNFTPVAFNAAFQAPFLTPLNASNVAVNAAVTAAMPTLSSVQTQLTAQQGLAFSKIVSVDPSGLITYLGKDGISVNYYNASGQAGVTANAANASTVQRVAVVNVANPNGLEKIGGSLYRPAVASGVPGSAFSLSTNSANGSSEKISTNSLEQSNVDMASEFVKMIMTQRAYSANSKTITTADEMTQEVLNLKR
ncbi:MAG: flagellar hook-basal body complex protein [Desulfuromonadaceae bacterium]|nr:flagellar hook-basal body complex protein [Desulfuromonadaceae bacterium]